MKIKDRLNLDIRISFITVIILFAVILISSNMVTEENRTHLLFREIYKAVTELDSIKYEYLLHHEKRMEQQWDLKYKSMMDLINAAEKEKAVKSVEADLVTFGNKFSQVVANYGKKQNLIQEGASEKEINLTLLMEEELIAQLLIKSHSIFSKCALLAENAHTKAERVSKFSINIIFIIMTFFALSMIISSLLISKSISKPLDKLKQGIEILSKGNLEHQIEIVSKDELGDFTSAFNQAVVSLKKITSSRDELNKEIIERKKIEEKLKKLAHFDTLTGCLTRGYGLALLEEMIKTANRSKTLILLLYLDINGFKAINDTYGHAEGDMVLKEVVQLFKSTLREIDIICRIGGDEFLLIFPENSSDEIPLIRERLNINLQKLNQTLNRPYKIDFSIGFSVYDPANPQTIEKLIYLADQKMYEDKSKNEK